MFFYLTRRLTRGTARAAAATVAVPAYLGTRAIVAQVRATKAHSTVSGHSRSPQVCPDCIREMDLISREMDALTEQINTTQDRIASDPAYQAALVAHVTELLTLADAYRR